VRSIGHANVATRSPAMREAWLDILDFLYEEKEDSAFFLAEARDATRGLSFRGRGILST
jgi:hypothetical protein